jgi:hypothetical protein
VVSFALLTAALFALGPAWPDDWDGLGFLASVTRFDLDAFAPHPPGYPVYVALLKLAGAALSPVDAAKVVFALSGASTVALLSLALRRVIAAPSAARVLVASSVLLTPLGLRCATAVGSEAPALALTSLALYGLAAGSSGIVGVAVGLALGVRASWAPLLLPLLLFAPRRRTAGGVAALAIALWAAPLVAWVGPSHLARLLATHLLGHATRWGGTALTEPSRVRFLLRDVFVDGFGLERDTLGALSGLALAASVGLSLRAWRRAGWKGARAALLVLGPYVAWIAVGQNLRDQPRHALPIVAALALALAVAATVDRRPPASPEPGARSLLRARVACGALFALLAVRSGVDASGRLRIPPPGAALAAYAASLPDAARLLVFGGPSARFFERAAPGARAFSVESMGDVALALARVDDPPSRVLVTDELSDRDAVSSAPLMTFCRPARLDRRRPCLSVFAVDVAALR